MKFVHYTFSSVWVAEWPPFGKYLPAWLAICSHCLLSICYLFISRFGFKSRIWLLVASVPVHCFSILLEGFEWYCTYKMSPQCRHFHLVIRERGDILGDLVDLVQPALFHYHMEPLEVKQHTVYLCVRRLTNHCHSLETETEITPVFDNI